MPLLQTSATDQSVPRVLEGSVSGRAAVRSLADPLECVPSDAALSLQDLVVVEVTPRGWRVSDGRRPVGDQRRLLAFVERRGDRFEVMQLGEGFEWHEFDAMATAVEYIIASGPRTIEERLRGELSWLR